MQSDTISLNEAKAHLSELVRNIRERKTGGYTLTYRGQPVARLEPLTIQPAVNRAAIFARIQELSQHVTPRRPDDPTIRDMIDAGRRM
jgi:antitoxin (DNA-binding transcriptional repressor) of toxin-antitoxin stability system